MLPFAATTTPLASKNFLPRVLVDVGPVKPCKMNAGLFGTAASSSASVGRRGVGSEGGQK